LQFLCESLCYVSVSSVITLLRLVARLEHDPHEAVPEERDVEVHE
jgi:hypothetical protein